VGNTTCLTPGRLECSCAHGLLHSRPLAASASKRAPAMVGQWRLNLAVSPFARGMGAGRSERQMGAQTVAQVASTNHRFQNGASVVVRTAMPEDAPAVYALSRTVLADGLADSEEMPASPEEAAEMIQGDANHPRRLCLIVVAADELVGLIRAKAGAHGRRHDRAGTEVLWCSRASERGTVMGLLIMALVDWSISLRATGSGGGEGTCSPASAAATVAAPSFRWRPPR
jgi:hypothetical protein